MVSIGSDNYQNSLTGSGRIQPDTTQLISDNEDVAFWEMASASGNPPLTGGDDDISRFHPIKSIPIIVTIMVLVTANVIFCFAIAEVCREKCFSPNPTAISWMSYVRIILFVVIMGADLLLRAIHNKSRSWGYLEFYRRTVFYRQFPLAAVSLGLAACLFVVVLTEELCDPATQLCTKNFSRANGMQIVSCVEAALILIVSARYLQVCRQFNKGHPTPDVLQEDLSTERILQTSINHGSQVGFKDANFKEALLEKQADEILYLQKRNAHLSARILHLTRRFGTNPEHSLA